MPLLGVTIISNLETVWTETCIRNIPPSTRPCNNQRRSGTDPQIGRNLRLPIRKLQMASTNWSGGGGEGGGGGQCDAIFFTTPQENNCDSLLLTFRWLNSYRKWCEVRASKICAPRVILQFLYPSAPEWLQWHFWVLLGVLLTFKLELGFVLGFGNEWNWYRILVLSSSGLVRVILALTQHPKRFLPFPSRVCILAVGVQDCSELDKVVIDMSFLT